MDELSHVVLLHVVLLHHTTIVRFFLCLNLISVQNKLPKDDAKCNRVQEFFHDFSLTLRLRKTGMRVIKISKYQDVYQDDVRVPPIFFLFYMGLEFSKML